MVILAITGKTDKRILAYPLMKACGLMGKTCAIAEDAAYRRLYSGTGDTGYINDVEVNIVTGLTPELAERMEQEKQREDFDYLIYLTESFVPPDAAKVAALCSTSRTFCGDELEGVLEDAQGRIVLASLTVSPKPKNYWKVPLMQIPWKPEYIQYICETEENRRLTPLKDKTVSQFLCGAFSKALSLQPGNMKKIMDRKLV